MTREECLRESIESSKFTNGDDTTVYFYDAMMNGDGEIFYFSDDEIVTVFKITEEDLKVFPELKDGCSEYYGIQVLSNGFVIGETMTHEQYNALIEDCQNSVYDE